MGSHRRSKIHKPHVGQKCFINQVESTITLVENKGKGKKYHHVEWLDCFGTTNWSLISTWKDFYFVEIKDKKI